MLKSLFAVTFLAAMIIGCQTDSITPPPPEEGIPGEQKPQSAAGEENKATAELISLSALDEKLAERKGQVVVLDIWSTSCLPCMKEFPNLVELSEKHPEGLACLSLNVDYLGLPKRQPDSYLPAVDTFLQKQKASKVTNYLSTDADSDVLTKYEVEAMPAIIVFDRAGKIVARLTDANASGEGLSYESDVIPLVEKLLAGE